MTELGRARIVRDAIARIARHLGERIERQPLDRPSLLRGPRKGLPGVATGELQRQETAEDQRRNGCGGYPAIVNLIRILSTRSAARTLSWTYQRPGIWNIIPWSSYSPRPRLTAIGAVGRP